MELVNTELETIRRSNVMEGVFLEEEEHEIRPNTISTEKQIEAPSSSTDTPVIKEVDFDDEQEEKAPKKHNYLMYGLIAAGALATYFIIRAILK